MAITHQEAERLLLSPELAAVEEAVATLVGQRLIRDLAVTTCSEIEIAVGFTPLELDDVVGRLRDDRELLVRFHAAVLADAAAMDDAEEYPPGEEPDPDDQPDAGQVVGLGTGFGVTAAVWVYFLRDRPKAELVDYLKKRRTPHAAKFARSLRSVFAASG